MARLVDAVQAGQNLEIASALADVLVYLDGVADAPDLHNYSRLLRAHVTTNEPGGRLAVCTERVLR
eukprot:6188098-Amphidinium_carterae.1